MKTSSGIALQTTTGELGLAMVNPQGIYHFQSWDLGRQLANQIQMKLAEFIQPLSWSDFDFIAVAHGPGSYTSTRIGVVTAKTLAQQLQVPVYGVSTLMSIAHRAALNFTPWQDFPVMKKGEYLAVEMKAHNQDVWGAIYQFQGKEKELKVIMSDERFTKTKWQEIIEHQQDKLSKLRIIKAPEKIALTAENLLGIALIKNQITEAKLINNWQNLTAFYEAKQKQ